jgi:Methyltransferase FkbM domain
MINSDNRRFSLQAFRPVQLEGLIRLGRDYDGGYVVLREPINRSEVLLSLGVNVDWSFEETVLIRNPAIRITCVDGTTGMKRALVKASQKAVDMLGHFLTLQIDKGVRDARYLKIPLEFYRFFSKHELLQLMVAKHPAPDSITLPKLIDRVTDGRQDCWVLLKMDIEGAEFDVLPPPINTMSQISTLIVEFHRVDLHWDRFVACVSDLRQTFHIAHVHGNNFDGYIPGTEVPATLEMTLVNKRLVAGNPPLSVRDYPITGLDMPCNWKRPDLRISFD